MEGDDSAGHVAALRAGCLVVDETLRAENAFLEASNPREVGDRLRSMVGLPGRGFGSEANREGDEWTLPLESWICMRMRMAVRKLGLLHGAATQA